MAVGQNWPPLGMRVPLLWSTTMTGATEEVVTPEAGKHVYLAVAMFSNASTGDCASIGLRFGTGGTVRFPAYLHSAGGGVYMNFIQAEINEGSSGDPLYVVMDTSGSPTVLATVGYYIL